MIELDPVDTDLRQWAWRVSSRSAQGATCVEVATDGVLHAVRDSKNPFGGVLVLSNRQWSALLGRVKVGAYDLED